VKTSGFLHPYIYRYTARVHRDRFLAFEGDGMTWMKQPSCQGISLFSVRMEFWRSTGKELDQLRKYGAPRIHPALLPLRRSPPRMFSTPFEFQIVLTPKPMHHTESTTLVLSLHKFSPDSSNMRRTVSRCMKWRCHRTAIRGQVGTIFRIGPKTFCSFPPMNP
jgi:hypothetical protein